MIMILVTDSKPQKISGWAIFSVGHAGRLRDQVPFLGGGEFLELL